MWALVPPMPKLLTPARTTPAAQRRAARRPAAGRGRRAAAAGCGSSANRLGGRMPWCRLSAALIRPAMPAAPSMWPMLPLIEPIAHGASRPATPCTSPSALTSIMSPSTVPVPWASTKSICSASHPGVPVCVLDHLLLGPPVGRGDPVAAPVGVDGAALDHRVDRQSGVHGVGQPSQDEHRDPLAAADAVRVRAERLAAPVGGGEPRLRVEDVQRRRQDEVDSAGQRLVARAGPQRGARLLHGDERRRAGRVDRDARALEIRGGRRGGSRS